MVDVFTGPLQEHPIEPSRRVDALVRLAGPGLMAMSSGHLFGWVIGRTLPASFGADWVVSEWGQNAAMRYSSPATAATMANWTAWRPPD